MTLSEFFLHLSNVLFVMAMLGLTLTGIAWLWLRRRDGAR